MTKAFVTFWKLRHGCQACACIPGKTMCSGCRARALKNWHRYVLTRLEKGLCIQCPRKQQPGEQRCERCAEANRENCTRYYHAVLKSKVEVAVKSGKCAICRKAPAESSRRNCAPCQAAANARARGEVRPTKPYRCFA